LNGRVRGQTIFCFGDWIVSMKVLLYIVVGIDG
jgi:hypothetical protein